jgi:predicted metal-dependent hydrolase
MWGSCTSTGVVRLTFRLIQLPPKLAHYVMAHEVSHLREMNHSPKFWAWVRVLDPHFKSNRRTLGAYTPLLEE